MTGEIYTLSGSVNFAGKVRGTRAEVENNAEEMLMELALYAKEKYPDYIWDCSRVSLWHKIMGLRKTR